MEPVRLKAVASTPLAEGQDSLYSLSWSYAQDARLAVDACTGIVVDANPAAEALMGYSRNEIIGMHVTMLHPEAERERVRVEFRKATERASLHPGLHIQRKDGSVAPVAIWSSETVKLAGRALTIVEFRDITDQKQKENLLSAQNWALSAFSIAALALGHARTAEGLLQAICEAITRQSVYVLAWVGIAEEGLDKKIRVAASAGSAVGYLDPVSYTHLYCLARSRAGAKDGDVSTSSIICSLLVRMQTPTGPCPSASSSDQQIGSWSR